MSLKEGREHHLIGIFTRFQQSKYQILMSVMSSETFKFIDPVKHRPKGYEAKVNSSSLLFFRTLFDQETGFPSVSAAILIDQNFHVKLQCNCATVKLPNDLHLDLTLS